VGSVVKDSACQIIPTCVLFLPSPLLLMEYQNNEMLNKQHRARRANSSGIYGELIFHFTALWLFSLVTLEQFKYCVPNLTLKNSHCNFSQ